MSATYTRPASPAVSRRTRPPALAIAVAGLMLVDIVGGLLAIATDVNTVGEAWGGKALLAAPLPFMIGQVLVTFVACRWPDRRGIAAAVLLALASGVSIASGFFDGGFGNAELTPALQTYQIFLLVVTGLVGVIAVRHARAIVRARSARG